MTLDCDAKFEAKLTCGLENDMRNLAKFSPEYLKVLKLIFSWDPFVQRRKCMRYKLTEELQVMALTNDEKSEEALTCRLKIDIKNLMNIDSRTQKSRTFTLYWFAFDQSM